MDSMVKETIIISLGGSVVVPDRIDEEFLKKFQHSLNGQLAQKRFFLFVGGGKVCRDYQKALLDFGADNTDQDWMGIHISRLNAQVVRQVFDKQAFNTVLTDPTKKVNSRRDIVVFGGWKPGWSTDYCAVMLAKNMGIKTIINLTNIDYVYEKDPKKFPSTKPIGQISWKDFRKIVGNTWKPGLSAPFDPRASKMAEILKIKVVIINGKEVSRLEQFFAGKSFIGTVIQWTPLEVGFIGLKIKIIV